MFKMKALFDGDSRGFTLIEILMVILLVGIVSAVVVPQYISFKEDAKKTVTQNRLSELKVAIIGDSRLVSQGEFLKPGFEANVGSVPTSLNDLVAQGSYANYDPFSKRGWRGPYVSTAEPNWDKDAWGTNFSYSAATRTITSCGKDKTCGNTDDIVVNF